MEKGWPYFFGKSSGDIEKPSPVKPTARMEDADLRIANNALRLFTDAKILHAAGRHPTAQALAILSIEEAGKLRDRQLRRSEANWGLRRFPPRHSEKQSTFLAEFTVRAQNRALIEICKYHATEEEWRNGHGEDDWEKTKGFLLDGWKRLLLPDVSGSHAHVVELLNLFAAYVDVRVAMDPLATLQVMAGEGDIDREKQKGFYLDVDKDDNVIQNPFDIQKDDADFFLRVATIAVHGLTTTAEINQAAEKFSEELRVWPPKIKKREFPTVDEWREEIARIIRAAGIEYPPSET